MAYYTSLPGQTDQFLAQEESDPQRINSYQRMNENVPTSERPVVREVHPGYVNAVYNPLVYAVPTSRFPPTQVAPAPVAAPVAVPVAVPDQGASSTSNSKCCKCCTPFVAAIITIVIVAVMIGLGVGLGLYFTNKDIEQDTATGIVTYTPCDDFWLNYDPSNTIHGGYNYDGTIHQLVTALHTSEDDGPTLLIELFDKVKADNRDAVKQLRIGDLPDFIDLLGSFDSDQIYNLACDSDWFKQKQKGGSHGYHYDYSHHGYHNDYSHHGYHDDYSHLHSACEDTYNALGHFPIC